MTLLGLPAVVVLLGLAALALLLYLLQRLRVQHEEVPVVTTMFWKAAVEETRARVLTRRFMHPWAYVLVLATSGLIWFAVAEPVTRGDSDTTYVLLLDGSAGMNRTGRYEAAVAALGDAVDDCPRNSTTVLFCGGRIRTLLAPGEDPLLLEARLESVAPEATPATVERTIRRLALLDGEVVVRVFGDAPLSASVVDSGVRVERAALSGAIDETNRSITALGVSDAASGTWDTVDVFVEVRGAGLGGLALDVPAAAGLDSERAAVGAHTLQVVYRDVPADGQAFSVSLPADDPLSVDDRAEIRLPRRRPIRIALSKSVEHVFGPVLASDPAVVLDAQDADVAVRLRGETVGGDAPAIELVPAADQAAAFHVVDPAFVSPELAPAMAVATLGLDEIDAQGLAQTAGRTIEVSVEPGDIALVRVWQELLGEPYDFVPSRAFPIFTARAVRWLAGVPDTIPYVAAGEPLSVDAPLLAAGGAVLDPLGAPFTPDRAATWTQADGLALTAALLDPTLASGAGADPASAEASASGGSSSLVTVLLLLAFALVLFEWHAYRTGRIP